MVHGGIPEFQRALRAVASGRHVGRA
jgi:hypothetical protein